MHGAPLNAPSPLELKLTVPVGVLGLVVSVSVTVTEHVLDCPATTLPGEQLTSVVVVSGGV